MLSNENNIRIMSRLVVIILFFVSCDSPTHVELEQEKIPENGIGVHGTEGVKFTGSIAYEFLDGRATIVDLASLEVPKSMQFKEEVTTAKINIVKQTDSGVLILNLYKNGKLSNQVKTDIKGKLLTLTYNIKQTHK